MLNSHLPPSTADTVIALGESPRTAFLVKGLRKRVAIEAILLRLIPSRPHFHRPPRPSPEPLVLPSFTSRDRGPGSGEATRMMIRVRSPSATSRGTSRRRGRWEAVGGPVHGAAVEGTRGLISSRSKVMRLPRPHASGRRGNSMGLILDARRALHPARVDVGLGIPLHTPITSSRCSPSPCLPISRQRRRSGLFK